jgi:hypothetical protein
MLSILGVTLSMVMMLGIVWAHPLKTPADLLAFFKYFSLWLLIIATALGLL